MKARLFIAIVVATMLAVPSFSEERTGPVGKMTVSSAAVEWQSSGSFDRLVLIVAAPNGTTVTREFQGSRATFRVADLAPRMVPDGTYVYELRALPPISDEVKQRLAAARAADDDAAVAKIKAEAGIGEPVVQSGAFSIRNGSFVTDSAEAPFAGKTPKAAANAVKPPSNVAANDVVTADDEIIQGSLCVGLDCVNNESFGFDTIRLKENNTRIKFDDTSTSAGFPNNDWQLTANDSNSGGANKFSIDDITNSKTPFTVTGNSPTNSIFVASSGKIGFGNSAPGLNLHITATDTPAIRQEQTSGGGFTAQTWDIGANEANWFVRDVTGGSRLPLRIRPGAPTSSVDISASGNVGFGNASPARAIDLITTLAGGVTARMQNLSATGYEGFEYVDNSGNTDLFIGEDNSLNQARYNSMNGNPHVFFLDGVEKMRVASTGVTVTGNFTVTGGTKNFAVVNPLDSSKAIYFAALEGPEAGTYYRGSAKTVDGKAVIKLPGYFAQMTECENMTVQLTPNGTWSQLFVAEKTPGQLVVKVADGAKDVEFDYFVQGVRKGFANYQVERENDLPPQQ